VANNKKIKITLAKNNSILSSLFERLKVFGKRSHKKQTRVCWLVGGMMDDGIVDSG